jgi:anti-anti-sigma factor
MQLENVIRSLSVDLGSLTFLDSSGLAALIMVRKNATEKGIEFRLHSVPRQIRRVLEACGTEELFGLQPVVGTDST